MMKQRFLIFLLLAISFYSCEEGNSMFSDQNGRINLRSESSLLLNASMILDQATIPAIPEDASRLLKASMIPTVMKFESNLKLYADGSVEMDLSRIPSENDFTIPTLSPPNDAPEVDQIKIRTGSVKSYDSDGNLLSTTPTQTIKLPDVARDIKSIIESRGLSSSDISDIMTCFRSNVDFEQVKSMINNPPSNTTVTEVADKVYAVRINNPFVLQGVGEEVVHLIDTENELLTGSKIYDSNGNFVTATYYRYNNCTLEGFVQQYYAPSLDGGKIFVESFTNISDIKIL